MIWNKIGVTPDLHARTGVTPEQVYLHLVIFYYLAQDWSYPELHARTGATPEQVYLHLVRLHYLTQDWNYPRTACPNWSYPSAGFACALVWLLGSVFGLRSSVLIGPWDPWTHRPLDPWTLGPVDPLDPKSLDPKSLDPWTLEPRLWLSNSSITYRRANASSIWLI